MGIHVTSSCTANYIGHKGYPRRGWVQPRCSEAHKNMCEQQLFPVRTAEDGFDVLGDNDSPIIPVMIYNPAKHGCIFTGMPQTKSFALCRFGYQACIFTCKCHRWLLLVLLLTRIRICISASHTRVDLINALEVISMDGDLVGIKSFPAGLKKDHEEDGMIKLDYVPEKIFHC